MSPAPDARRDRIPQRLWRAGALSKVHEREAVSVPHQRSRPRRKSATGRAESLSGLFGGNSNWRGPIWLPVNYLLIESLQSSITTTATISKSNALRAPANSSPSTKPRTKSRAASPACSSKARMANARAQISREARERSALQDYVLFHEYFHGDTGRGRRRIASNRLDRPHRQAADARKASNNSTTRHFTRA